MQDEPQMTPAERELEAALGKLRPAGSIVDPLAAAYDAGQASLRRRLAGWRLATGSLAAALLAAIAVPGAFRSGPAQLPQANLPNQIAQLAPTFGSGPESSSASDSRAAREYLSLRDGMVSEGLSALPAPGAAPSAPSVPTVGQSWLQQRDEQSPSRFWRLLNPFGDPS
jgi:hypothetical protein